MKHAPLWIFLAVLAALIAALAFAFLSTKENEEVVEDNPDPDWVAYENESAGYATLYPAAFAVDANYAYTGLGPDKAISGVSFTVPESLTRGTNLSKDSYFSIEALGTSTAPCTATAFLGEGAKESVITENGVRYSVGRRTEAGAGNMYEEHVYAFDGASPCVATRYFMHSTNIGNYEPGQVIEFNRGSLISVFDTIRQSIRFESPESEP